MERLISKYKIQIILFLLTTFLYSCNGIRYALPEYFSGYAEVNLYKNGRFYMQDYSPMLGNTDYYGKWIKNRDTITLNIKMTKRIDDWYKSEFIVKELHKRCDDSIYFEIKVFDCSTNSGGLIINDSEIWINNNGFLQIPKQKIQQIGFNPRICYANVNYNIIDLTTNYFYIEIKKSFEPAFTTHTKYIKTFTKLIPIINDSIRHEFALKRKLFAKSQVK